MKNLVQLSKLLNIVTVLVILGVTVFQINKLDTLSSEIDDIGVYRTIVEAQKRKKEFYQIVETSSDSQLIHEIEMKGDVQAKTLASYLQMAHILEPTLKFIANYQYLYSVALGWTYAPGQYFMTQLLVNGEESYQAAKLKIRAVSKFFWLLGIIVIIIILSKFKEPNIAQAGLLFLILVICSQSQTSYSAHGSSYAAGVFASSIAMLVMVKLFKSEQLSIPSILLLIIVSIIQYQLIPLVILIFLFAWVRHLFYDNLTKKDKAQNLFNLIKNSLIFALLFITLVFPTFQNKLGSGLNWNAGKNLEYTLNDNYLDLFHEIKFQKIITLMIEPINAFIDTCASIYSPIPFSVLTAKFLGLSILTLIFLAFFNLSKNKLLRPYILASISILLLHILLYIFGLFPLSPTRHSLYLTVPLTVLGVIGLSHLITIFETRYPKLTNPLLSLAVLLLALTSGFLNANYILKRVDPFDEVRVLELLSSSETPEIILNSDWTYQHYQMPQVQKVKILLDLNLHSKREQFGKQLDKIRPLIGTMKNGDTIHLMRVSHWGPLDKDNTQKEEITGIICKYFEYKCSFKSSQELFTSTKEVSPEWVVNIQGFSNSLYIDTLSISILKSSSKN